MPSLLGFGTSLWRFAGALDNYSTAVLASQGLEHWFALAAFSSIPIIATKNGTGTVSVYRTALRRIDYNIWALSHDAQPLAFPWEIESLSSTYCARAGVRAAARKRNFENELPRGYTKWWCIIDTRKRYTRAKKD
ncbi:hypothetical protein [Paraburkholderia flagellata]|uniref:hypothetical protein n=1 Tax=Paraburkholderia flagellata TaxID=2883241 RepID=UPI001F21C829|nr:hypothetical protein [Paraburkholderia flagellata]